MEKRTSFFISVPTGSGTKGQRFNASPPLGHPKGSNCTNYNAAYTCDLYSFEVHLRVFRATHLEDSRQSTVREGEPCLSLTFTRFQREWSGKMHKHIISIHADNTTPTLHATRSQHKVPFQATREEERRNTISCPQKTYSSEPALHGEVCHVCGSCVTSVLQIYFQLISVPLKIQHCTLPLDDKSNDPLQNLFYYYSNKFPPKLD